MAGKTLADEWAKDTEFNPDTGTELTTTTTTVADKIYYVVNADGSKTYKVAERATDVAKYIINKQWTDSTEFDQTAITDLTTESTTATITAVEIRGEKVILTISENINSGDQVRVSYDTTEVAKSVTWRVTKLLI